MVVNGLGQRVVTHEASDEHLRRAVGTGVGQLLALEGPPERTDPVPPRPGHLLEQTHHGRSRHQPAHQPLLQGPLDEERASHRAQVEQHALEGGDRQRPDSGDVRLGEVGRAVRHGRAVAGREAGRQEPLGR
ncbi:MAG: hypothetical protein IPM45_16025 [Acidimicrobiales bacterium]|nr:hypothetical protein [Acidimicrobiales bacterium]